MNVEIPDQCECEDDFACAKCTWETANAIVEINNKLEQILNERGDNND